MMQHDNLIGFQLGDFLIHEQIGMGGMAAVYRAEQLSMKRNVALKVIDSRQVLNPEDFQERFAKEAELVASLEHIHILPVYDYGTYGNYAYLAMRLLRGGTLRDVVGHDGLSLERIGSWFDQIALGLAHAHNRGIIHRDIKPANIMLDDNGNLFLTDFGLAKMIDSGDSTRTNNIVGTLSYMSPEQLRGDPLDHRSDIYSLGVVLYHMVCGRTPFHATTSEDIVAVIYKHLQEMPPAPHTIKPDISQELEGVILKALAKLPNERFQDVGEMALAVRNATGASVGPGNFPPVSQDLLQRARQARSVSQSYSTAPHSPRSTIIAGVIGGLVVLIVGFLLLFGGQLLPIGEVAIPSHSVMIGEQEFISDMPLPTEEQIALAQRKLGEDGFIANITCNLSSEYHATLNREISDQARAYGLEISTYNSDSDAYNQRNRIEEALADDARAIILCPLDYSLLTEPLAAIQNNQLPLVMFHPTQENTFGGVFVSGADDYEMGIKAGHTAGGYIRDELGGQANVVILDFPDLESIVQRANGIEDGILEYAPDATISGRYLGATRANGYQSMQELLEEGQTVQVVASINDAGAYGAIEALSDAGYAPDSVAVFGIDAEQLAQQYITEGYFMRGTLQVGRRESAQAAVDLVTRMLAGDSVPELVRTQPGAAITAETLAQAVD